MQRYIGMDVHAASCSLCILNESGKKLRQDVVETNGKALVGYFQQQPGQLHLCLEESEWAQWLHEILAPQVAELVVHRAQRNVGSKNDQIDAYALAERLRTGRVGQPVFKAPRSFMKLRELSRVYKLLSCDVARTKNRLKSTFRRRGLCVSGTAIYRIEGRKKRVEELPAAMKPVIELLGCQLDQLEELKTLAAKAMIRESHRYRISKILKTVPGLGPIRVAQLMAIVITPHRFRTKRQFWAYCGLAVTTRSSADWVRVGDQWQKDRVVQTRGLNRNHNHALKAIFKGAATTVLQQKSNRFRDAYDRLCDQGTKPNLAKVTVARQLAATALSMWKSEEVYDPKR